MHKCKITEIYTAKALDPVVTYQSIGQAAGIRRRP